MDTCLSESLCGSGSGKQSQAAGRLPRTPHKPGASTGETEAPPAWEDMGQVPLPFPQPVPSCSPLGGLQMRAPAASWGPEEGRRGVGQGQGHQHPAQSPEWAWVEGRDAPQEKAMPGCKLCSSAGRRGVRPRRPPSRTLLAWCGEAEGAALAHPTRGHSRCLGGGEPLPLACGDPQQK